MSNIAGIIILLGLTNIVIAYSKGEFEVPFYDRNPDNNYVIAIPTNPREEITTVYEEPTQPITNIRDVINPDDLIEPEPDPGAAHGSEPPDSGGDSQTQTQEPEGAPAFERYSDELRRRGFAVSDGVYELYDEAAINARISAYKTEAARILEAGTDPVPPPPQLYEYRFVQIEPGYEIPQTRYISTNYATRPAVEPLMDFIIIRSGEYEILCTADGRALNRDFGALNWEILKMRDDQNRTVFKSRSEDLYYVYEPSEGERGAFKGISFNPLFGSRGVPFMYPSYYGANGANNIERTRSGANGKWGYILSDTRRQLVNHIYGGAFNFNENIGVAYQDSPGRGNRLFFLNANGQDLLRGDYFAPDDDEVTINHLGFFYFDHGMTRAYWRGFDIRGHVIVSRETILQYKIDSRGYAYFSEFYVPEDYDIKAYSNGMILLEKNGFSGFMNYLGEWVYQPVYEYAQPFFEGVAVIGHNGKRALIDANGNLLTRFKYDYISNCTGGTVALFERSEGWTILNKVRRVIEID